MRVFCLILLGAVAGAWSLLQAWSLADRWAFRRRSIFLSPARRLLVVVSHQDDETVVAGGMMMQCLKAGGCVRVIYTMDGATAGRETSSDAIRRRTVEREQEALKALQLIGIPRERVMFLRYRNQLGLQVPADAAGAVRQIAAIIAEFAPDRLIVPAFEGGHVDHDLTHIVAVWAALRTGYPKERMLEAPEYNQYYLQEYLKPRLNRLLIVPFLSPPRFLPKGPRGNVLTMSQPEIDLKRKMLLSFETCNPEWLVRRFAYPDQFRPIPSHAYEKAPFIPSESLAHWFRARVRREPHYNGPYFPPALTGQNYECILQRVVQHLKAGT